MRFTSSVAALTALLSFNAQIAAAAHGYVYTADSTLFRRKTSLNSLSPATARLVLAQRAGLEDFHSTHGLTAEEIRAVNQHGLQTRLFDGDRPQKQAFLLAPLEDEDGKSYSTTDAEWRVADIPSFAETVELWSDLLQQANPSIEDAGAYLYDASTLASLTSATPWFHVSDSAAASMKKGEELTLEGRSVTILMVPAGERAGNWGSYEMPHAASYLAKRTSRRVEEEPLSLAIEDTSIPTLMASNSSSNYSNNRPLEGILPACFTSQKTCESRTRGCTGHGECKKKYTNADSKNHPECWSCDCTPTKSNGLTTYWAGPACQKKDISVEFWLVALFTIGLMALVSFAVGTIWSMGEQELPSVIGAGVSGPTARK